MAPTIVEFRVKLLNLEPPPPPPTKAASKPKKVEVKVAADDKDFTNR